MIKIGKLLVLPSATASIFCGAVITPLFVWILRILQSNEANDFILFSWGVIGFFIPVVFATADIGYLRQRWKARTLFSWMRGPHSSSEDFREFYIPAWKRIFIWFASMVVSIIALKSFDAI